MPRTNLSTRQFGLLTVLFPTDERQGKNQAIIYQCLCQCGNTTRVSEFNLRGRHTKSCGCLKHRPTVRRIDLTGQRFGMLVALRPTGTLTKHESVLWLCICDCGNEYVGRASSIKAKVRSCGCKVGKRTHGLSQTKSYHVHKGMVERCHNEQVKEFRNYGARGIKVCARWRNMKHFVADMGQPPAGLTIERIDNDGGYWCGSCDECKLLNHPRNCKWDTWANQQINRRTNHHLTALGKTQTVSRWVKELGIAKNTILNRLKRGWTEERALTTPPNPIHRKRSIE